MAVSSKAIKQKIKSVGNIKKITKTMEMVSASKMKKATENVYRGRLYAKYALELISNLAKIPGVRHPMLGTENTPKSNKELVIVISSNKGLAGAYNSNIARALAQYKKTVSGDIEAVTVGRFSEKATRQNQIKVVASFIKFNEKTPSNELLIVRDVVTKLFLEEEYKKVSILFTELKSSLVFKPFIMQLLPVVPNLYKNQLLSESFEIKTDETFLNTYKVEPNKETVLREIIPHIIGAAIHHAFLESVGSEHSARMIAMKSAGDNAEAIMDDLTLYYNQARQAAITQEISEIVGGAAAV